MKVSKYKTGAAKEFVESWIDETIGKSDLNYEKLDVETSFGRTRVLAANHSDKSLKTLVYVPGARTCGAFLELSNNIRNLGDRYRIYLLDVVGQIGLSEGNCPSLKDASYGKWLAEVCDRLEAEKAVFAGASFGGEIILKLASVACERIEKAVLMNPIGFSNVSFSPVSLYRTLLPVLFPSRRSVESFMNAIVFAPDDGIGAETKTRVTDFVENAVKNFQFAGEYPSRLGDGEIENLKAETHLIVGERDGLIPFRNTIKRAEKLLPDLRSVKIFPEQAHGIEGSSEAVLHLCDVLKQN